MNNGLINSIFKLIKIKQTLLLVFTCIATYYIASHWHIYVLDMVLLVLSAFLVISGTTMVNMYYDRGIDAQMTRTRTRPLVIGQFSPSYVLFFGIVIFLIGLVIGYPLGPYFCGLELLGFIINIGLYTIILKRTHSLSFIFGSIAGGIPSIAGWVAYSQQFEITGILIGLIVMAWIPTHILSLAVQYKDDFKRAKIPVLPNQIGDDLTIKLILVSNIVLSVILIAIFFIAGFGVVFFLSSVLLNSILFIIVLHVYRRSTNTAYGYLYRYAGVYLLLIFIAMMIDRFALVTWSV